MFVFDHGTEIGSLYVADVHLWHVKRSLLRFGDDSPLFLVSTVEIGFPPIAMCFGSGS